MTGDNDRPPVVVGVDGSRAGVRAALWGAEAAQTRDAPLRLVSVIDPADPGSDEDRLANARTAVRQARSAVQSRGTLVDIQTDVVRGAPAATLRAASRSAAMICVGPIGLRHFGNGHVGSTAAALALDAHCPVAVVPAGDGSRTPGGVGVVVETVAGTDDVVALGVREALSRHAALRIVLANPAAGPDDRARLDRRLAEWRHRYPELDIESTVAANAIDHLTQHCGQLGLVVVGARDRTGVGHLLGPTGCTALRATNCTVLVTTARQQCG